MTRAYPDDLEVLAEVADELVACCSRIRGDQVGLATPCSEWNLGQLLDHVTGGNRFTVAILDGASAESAMADVLGSFGEEHEPGPAAAASIRRLQQAFAEPGALERRCHHLVGELTGHQVLALRLHDLIIHTWDIAEASAPPATITDPLMAWSWAELARPDSRTARHFALALEAPETARPRDHDALLALFGRGRPSPRA